MSVSNQARRRGEILAEIMSHHRERLPKLMRETPLADLRALALVAPDTIDLEGALRRPGVSLIAECKKASPSKGLIAPRYNPVDLAQAYREGGASAISVLTDGRHFQGALTHLRDVKESLIQTSGKREPIPVLRKDFIFHPYHCYEARVAGADAILLIAAVLSRSDLVDLLALTNELEMKALVEVHTEEELQTILPLEPDIIGINNRNLNTFEVDFENTERLRRSIPDETLVVAESGIRGPEEVRRLRDVGVDAVLVGESLVRSRDVA